MYTCSSHRRHSLGDQSGEGGKGNMNGLHDKDNMKTVNAGCHRLRPRPRTLSNSTVCTGSCFGFRKNAPQPTRTHRTVRCCCPHYTIHRPHLPRTWVSGIKRVICSENGGDCSGTTFQNKLMIMATSRGRQRFGRIPSS